jgi:hypothetical protein
MLVGLKSFMVSRTIGLYGLKLVKLSASTGDFFYLILYNWSILLQVAPRVGWPRGGTIATKRSADEVATTTSKEVERTFLGQDVCSTRRPCVGITNQEKRLY